MKSKEERIRDAAERRETRAMRSAREQLAVLDSRLGTGNGAQKERARLMKLIEKEEG